MLAFSVYVFHRQHIWFEQSRLRLLKSHSLMSDRVDFGLPGIELDFHTLIALTIVGVVKFAQVEGMSYQRVARKNPGEGKKEKKRTGKVGVPLFLKRMER